MRTLYTPQKDENGKYLVRNLKESQHGSGHVDLEVYCEPLGGWVPFHAWESDPVEHGREVYQQVIAEQAADIVPLSQEEKDEFWARTVRGDRDDMLKDTDWTQAPDVPEATRTAYTVYRQALRDIPQQEGFPYTHTWPDRP